MGIYDVKSFRPEIQTLINENKLDKNNNGKIDTDNGELSELLSLTESTAPGNLMTFGAEYESNSKSNMFLKEYLEGKAVLAGIKIPDGMSLTISSPKEVSKEYKNLLRDVRTNIYGARIADMMNLLVQNSQTVAERVQQMKITDEEKDKILKLKQYFDNYYKIEANYEGKVINLIDSSEADKKALEEISPEFAGFIDKEQNELKKHVINFAQKEMEADELSEAGFWSRVGAPVVMSILGLSLFRGVQETRQNAKAAKDMTNFLKEQQAIYKAGRPLFVNPLKAYAAAFKSAKAGGKAGLAIGGTVLASYLWKTLIGSLDDLAGCVKDSIQDADNFGVGTSLAIALPSAAVGVLSSAFISPTIDAHIEFNRAEKVLMKNGLLPKLKGFKKIGRMGVKGLVGAGLGVIIAACSSGSSWASMAGTRYVFGRNGDKLVEKNIISEQENTSKNSVENMMKYEAYYGKWDGIAKGDPTIGSVGGGLGLFTHTNPYLQNISFGLQGCSETLTACGVQMFGNVSRESKLNKEKAALVESVR